MRQLKHLAVKYYPSFGFLLLFCGLTAILYCSPLISDDFEFADNGYRKLSQVLPYVLYYGNGRLLGNIGAVWLINYPLLCATIKSAMICGIIWALPRAAGIQHKPECSVIAALLLLLMNPDIFAQVFTWTSGFMNYVPPTLTMLLCIILVRNSNQISYGRMLLLGMLGFAGQLFVEHATVIHILLAALLVLQYHTEKDSVRSRYALCWLFAAFAGALLMFVLPKIFFLEDNRTIGYRTLHLLDTIKYATTSIILILHTLSRNVVLFCSLSIFAVTLHKTSGRVVSRAGCWYWIYPAISFAFLCINSEFGVLKLLRYILLYGGMLLYIVLFLIDLFKFTDKSTSQKSLILAALAITSLVPFLIISPFGERCIFLCYILLVLIVFCGINFLLEHQQFKVPFTARIVVVITLIFGLILLATEFNMIDRCNTQRDDYIQAQLFEGQTEITIFNLPSRYAFHTYLPEMYYYQNRRWDTDFIIVDYEEWLTITGMEDLRYSR